MDQLNQPATETASAGYNSASAVKARIAQFCNVTGDEPVTLKVRKGEMYVTDEFIDWCKMTGASLDWIISGDPSTMIRACRKAHENRRPFIELLEHIPQRNRPRFLSALQAHRAGLMPLDQVIEAMWQDIDAKELAAKP